MRPRTFATLSLVLLTTGGIGSWAAAQPKKGHDKPPRARSSEPAPDASAPSAPSENLDAGAKISPLTPTKEEFATLDAGAPVDYDSVLSELAALRARVATVSDSLFKSRIQISLLSEADHARVTRVVLSLDDGAVYTSATAPERGEPASIFSRSVSPGRHAVTLEIERKDERNEAFRSAQRSRFVVEVPKDEELKLEVKIVDNSTMGKDFPDDKNGTYDLRIKVKAESRRVKK